MASSSSLRPGSSSRGSTCLPSPRWKERQYQLEPGRYPSVTRCLRLLVSSEASSPTEPTLVSAFSNRRRPRWTRNVEIVDIGQVNRIVTNHELYYVESSCRAMWWLRVRREKAVDSYANPRSGYPPTDGRLLP